MDTTLLLFASLALIFGSFFLLVFGFVPDEVNQDEIYGYRLTKRKRLVESDSIYALFLPFIQIFAHYFSRLPDHKWPRLAAKRADTREKLMRSGFMGAYTPNEFLGLSCLSAVGMFVAGMVISTLLFDSPKIGLAFVMAGVGGYMPTLQLASAITDRLIEIDRKLPYTIDLLVLSMRAGLDFMTALDRVVNRGLEQNPDDAIVQELGVVLQEMRVGSARSDALINLCERVKSEYLQSMVGAILQSEKRGSPLATVLEVQIGTIRTKRTQKVEKLASQAAVKILLPLMFIFAAVLVVVIGAMVLKVKNQ